MNDIYCYSTYSIVYQNIFFLNVWFFPFLCLMESSLSDNCSLLLLWMHCCAIQFWCTHLKQVMFRTKGKRRLENLMCIALEEGCNNNTTNLYTSTNVMQFTWFPSSALVSLSSFLMHSEVFIIQFLFFFFVLYVLLRSSTGHTLMTWNVLHLVIFVSLVKFSLLA